MDYLFLMSGFLLSLLLGMMIVPKILLISYKKRLFDMPDSRKVHEIPVPRLGGISFFPVILIVLCFILGVRFYCGYPIENLPTNVFLFFAVGGMMLFLIGVADDLVGVGYRYKFLVQILAAFLIVWPGEWFNTLGGLFGIYELPKILGVLFTLFVVVYITNAINLIDGIDGLASGLSSISLFVLGLICMVEGDEIYALLAFSTFGVIVPFWFYNVFGNAKRGHKLFMGDTGSLILGYIISLLVIHLLRTGLRPRAVMVFILFIALFFIVLNWLLTNHMGMTGLLITDIVLWSLLQLGINQGIKKNKETKKTIEV